MTKNKKEVEVTATNLPAVDYDYSAYTGQGFEGQTRDDLAVPFLGVLQANSPLVDRVAEAKAGMLLNTVTNEIFDGKKGLLFVPATTQHVVVEWKPRDQGGGFVAIHALDSDIVVKAKAEQEFGKYKTVKGDLKSNDLVETFYVYGILTSEDGSRNEQIILAFTSTKIKVYKRWMTKARTVQVQLPSGQRINPPLFAHKYRVTTIKEENSKGSFYNLQIDFDGAAENCRIATSDPLFKAALGFSDLIKGGEIRAAYDSQTQTGDAAGDDDIPFEDANSHLK